MQRTLLCALITILFSLASFMLGHAGSPGPIKLKYSNFFPVTHPYAVLGQQLCDEIKKRTDGKVEITYYPGGILTSATKMYDGVVNGVSDLGFSNLLYTKGRFSVCETLNLPVGYMTGYVATEVMNEFYAKFKPKEWDKVHLLHFIGSGPTIIATSKKPVRKLEDLTGVKIRGAGRGADIVKALGGTPVPVEMADAYDGLQRGVIDGVFDAMETYKGWKLGELLRHSTQSQAVGMSVTFYVVMNKEKWSALPDDLKRVFNEVSAEWMKKYGALAKDIDEAGKDFFQNQGGQIIPLSGEEVGRWKKAVQPVFEQHIKDLEAKGIKRSEAESYLKFINERISYWTRKAK